MEIATGAFESAAFTIAKLVDNPVASVELFTYLSKVSDIPLVKSVLPLELTFATKAAAASTSIALLRI